nr:retrovirus-related Pol polyprotein from transposon TNT 1-94 [Tanacetum cinerariifolium]
MASTFILPYFDTINDLTKNDLVSGLPKFKYNKEHLCPSCEQGKSKRASHPPKPVPNSRQRLHLLHMDLCGPMRIASINGKRYVLVIMDDYSRYTWVHFFRSKDEAPEVIKTFLKRITILLQSLTIIIRTDNGTEFKNQVLQKYFDSVGISHQVSSVRTPQQNGVVERRNRTLVEAARTMLIFSRAPLFLWAEVIATACFTQNRSIIHCRFNKTPYELINRRKLDISFLHVFGALCYPKNDREDIGKLGAKGLDLTYAPSTITTQQPTKGELDLLFEAMYDDNIGGQPSSALRIDVNGLNSQQQHAQQQGNQAPIQPETIADNVPNAMFDANTFFNPFATSSTSAVESSSSLYVDPSNMHTFYQPYPHEFQWTKDHPLEQLPPLGCFLGWSLINTLNCSVSSSSICSFDFKRNSIFVLNLASKIGQYVSLSACCAQVLWMRTQLMDYGFHFDKILIYCDSKSAIVISCNPVQHLRTKHIAVRYHFIKEHVEKGTIELYFVKTDYQLADIFTKALPTDRFNYLVRRLGMRSLSPQELDRMAKSQ